MQMFAQRTILHGNGQAANLLQDFGVLLLFLAICLAVRQKAASLIQMEQDASDIMRFETLFQRAAAKDVRIGISKLVPLPGDSLGIIGRTQCNFREQPGLDKGPTKNLFAVCPPRNLTSAFASDPPL